MIFSLVMLFILTESKGHTKHADMKDHDTIKIVEFPEQEEFHTVSFQLSRVNQETEK